MRHEALQGYEGYRERSIPGRKSESHVGRLTWGTLGFVRCLSSVQFFVGVSSAQTLSHVMSLSHSLE